MSSQSGTLGPKAVDLPRPPPGWLEIHATIGVLARPALGHVGMVTSRQMGTECALIVCLLLKSRCKQIRAGHVVGLKWCGARSSAAC